ncbi:MAG: YtxH domain-containing protein [Ardenticatenaceae bacterium]|nr:YtxH domain-containing protein [Ardenticatenaceae bacterium]
MGNRNKTMDSNNEEAEHEAYDLNRFLAGLVFLAGLLFGGLVGAGVMLLLAPQSGKKTRRQIWRKGRDLREQATDAVEDTVAQVRASIHEQTEMLQQRGQDALDEGKERFATVVEAGKAAVTIA